MSKKYFINNLNSAFGNALLSQLVKQPTQDPLHMCTMKHSQNIKPNGIKKILKRQKPKLFSKKATQQCQIFIYNIDQTQIQDIQFGLEMMKKPFQDNKVFILVSDIMVWTDTAKKIKKEIKKVIEGEEPVQGEVEIKKDQNQKNNQQNDQDKQDQNSQQPEENNQQDQDQVIQSKPIEYTFWQDIDYQSRQPLPKYQFIKDIQDKILQFKRQNVKIFIICPGIIYGCGQNTFYPFFKAAWLQQPYKLPYLNDGDNLIPTIHLKDLVKFVIKLAQSPPEESCPYLLAFDMTKQKSQKCLIKAISQGIGSGEIQSVQSTSLIEVQQKFKLNIDIKPSKFFVGTEQQPVEFEWSSKFGIKQSIKLLLKDFCSKQGHRPIKLIMYQKQFQWTKQSKINYILQKFSFYYKIPILTLNKILQYAKQFAPSQLLQDLNQQWQNIQQYIKNNNQILQLNETMKVLYRVIRWRLLNNDCTNRGFILYNYPNFRGELENVFNKMSMKKFKRKVVKKKKQIEKKVQQQEVIESKNIIEGDERNQNNENDNQQLNENKEEKKQQQPQQQPPVPQQQPVPQPQQQQPIQQGDQNAPKFQSYFPQSLIQIKRMGTQLQQLIPLIQYFISNNIQQLVYDTTLKSQTQIFESIRSHIERNGRPNNYLIQQQLLLNNYRKFIQKQNTESLQQKERRLAQQKEKVKQIQSKRNNLAKEIMEIVSNEGEDQIKKMPFRNYLMEFVVPTLNDGLLEVSNIIPNDPVDLLAEYLYQKSYDV